MQRRARAFRRVASRLASRRVHALLPQRRSQHVSHAWPQRRARYLLVPTSCVGAIGFLAGSMGPRLFRSPHPTDALRLMLNNFLIALTSFRFRPCVCGRRRSPIRVHFRPRSHRRARIASSSDCNRVPWESSRGPHRHDPAAPGLAPGPSVRLAGVSMPDLRSARFGCHLSPARIGARR